MNGVREFNRLQVIDLKGYQCETILSIRRSGLDSETEKWCRLIHVFCTFPAIRKRCAKLENVKPDAHGVSPGAISISSRIRIIWNAEYYHRKVRTSDGRLYRHPAFSHTIPRCVLLAVTQLKANPEYQNHRQHRREEIRSHNIRYSARTTVLYSKRQE